MNARWFPPVVAFFASLSWRGCILVLWPTAYAFDGYQRWAGRDHILVQDWLPATQSVIWLVASLGGGIREGRIAMSLVGAVAAALGTLLVQQLAAPAGERAARVAGWAFVVGALFGPWGSWGTVFYQESTFIGVLFGALYLASSGRLVAADLVIGLLGLVRYEGWPCVLLYMGWRREWRSTVATWGIAVWIGIRLAGIEGYHASPVNFADWEGLSDRFSWKTYRHDLEMLIYRLANSGGMTWVILGTIGLLAFRRSSMVVLLGLLFASQAAATFAWLAGLEVSTSRMLVIPTALAATLGALGVAWAEAKVRWKWIAPVSLMVVLAISLVDSGRRANVEGMRVRQERAAVATMEECPGCTWWVVPRKRLGTRERHDGCEVIQGITDMQHGREFFCAPWVGDDDTSSLYATCSGTVRWDGGKREYVVERHLAGTASAPPIATEETSPPEPTQDE